MREPTDQEVTFVRETINKVFARNNVAQWQGDMVNPYLLEIQFPVSVGEDRAKKTFNDLFHALGVLPEDENLGLAEGRDYCATCVNEGGETYSALFNVPFAKDFKEGDEEYQFTIKAINDEQEAEAEAEEAEMHSLVEGIKAGRLKSKTADGYLVLAGEFYDAIEAGKKTVEYRDFTEYNIKRTIGLKTIRFNRGYGSKGKPPKQMQWEVKGIVLMDDDENECDPYNVPEDFWPVTIALKLGKRIG